MQTAGNERSLRQLAKQTAEQLVSGCKTVDQSKTSQRLSDLEAEFRDWLQEEVKRLLAERDVRTENPTLDAALQDSDDVAMTVDGFDSSLNPLPAIQVRALAGDGSSINQRREETLRAGNHSDTVTPYRSTAKHADLPPDYQLLDVLGQGGMGIVYKALHVPLNRIVAVKMILAGAGATPKQVMRFYKEAEAVAQLAHPNIVGVHEVGDHNGLPFFSLDFVEGGAMNDLMKDTTLTPRKAAELLLPVARAIEYSHQRGILHRDIKPHNILVRNDGTPLVADFGLAKQLGSNDGQTVTGAIVGTPGYLSPEQVSESKNVGPQSDVFSMGCVLYYAMTGKPPFSAPTAVETVRLLLSTEPVMPSRLYAGLDQDLETICLKALEKDVNNRYQTANEFADELERYLNGQPIVARHITGTERVWKWAKRNPKIAALSAAAGALLGILLISTLVFSFVLNGQKQREVNARVLAEQQADRADQNAEIAENQAEIALDSNRVILFETKNFFNNNPELQPLRKKFLRSIQASVEKLRADAYTNDVTGIQAAAATHQLGRLYLSTGDYDKALAHLTDAENALDSLETAGSVSRAKITRMDLSLEIGDALLNLRRPDEALERFENTKALREAYFEKTVNVSDLMQRQSMSEVYGKLWKAYLAKGQLDIALKYAVQSVEIRRKWYEQGPESLMRTEKLAGALASLTNTYERRGELQMMDAAGEELRPLLQVLEQNAADGRNLYNVAIFKKSLGRQKILLKEFLDAKSLLNESANIFRRLVVMAPKQNRYRSQAVDVLYTLGIVTDKLGESSEAIFREAESTHRKLPGFDRAPFQLGTLMKILARAGDVEQAVVIADQLSQKTDNEYYNGFAAVGYALASEKMTVDSERKKILVDKSIECCARLIDLGFRDFESMRHTDVDFEPLQQEPAFLKMLDEKQAAFQNK